MHRILFSGVAAGALLLASPVLAADVVPVADGASQAELNAETTRATAAETGLLPKSGGTLTGPLTLAADPTSAMQAATQRHVLAHTGGGGGGTITDAPIAALSSGRLATSGLNNVLSYAGGIPINDGGTHTVGNAPSGSIFYGITTLAKLAAVTIDGTQPFFFLTDNGTITGPMGTAGATTNPFIRSDGAYKLTDAKVANIDIAWLAIQAAFLTRRAYIPGVLSVNQSNGYQIGTAMPLPLMIPISSEGDGNNMVEGLRIEGDGARVSVLFAGSSFGTLPDGITMIPLVSCGDPAATPSNKLGRWNANGMFSGNLNYVGFWGSHDATSSLSSTYQTDGVALGARLFTNGVRSAWFRHDITLTGDHATHINLVAQGGVFGVRWTAPNTVLLGDFTFVDMSASGAVHSAVEVDGGSGMGGFFKGETYLNGGLYAIYGDDNGCSAIVGAAHFDNLMTEYLGLGVVSDGHNFNIRTQVYSDGAKCRPIVDINVDHWFTSYSNGNITTGTGRRRRASFDVSTVSGRIHGIDTNGGNPMPISDNLGAAGIAMINLSGIGDIATGLGLELEGSMKNVFSQGVGAGVNEATIPVLSANAGGGTSGIQGLNATWQMPGGDGGTFAGWASQGSYTSTLLGDLMEYQSGTFSTATPAGYNAGQPLMGVVAQSGLTTGMVVPLQTRGLASISTGNHNGNDGFESKATGVGGRTTFTGGSGGTAGTYTITATGGGCSTEPTYNVVVGGSGAITSVQFADQKVTAGCTSIPTVSLSSISGLTGASVTPQWPAAGVNSSGSPATINAGYGLHAGQGSLAAGTKLQYSRLLGMQ